MGFHSAPEAASRPITSAPEIRVSSSLAILDHCCSRLRLHRDVPRPEHRSSSPNYLAATAAERLNAMPATVNSDGLPSAFRLKVRRVSLRNFATKVSYWKCSKSESLAPRSNFNLSFCY